MLPSDADVDVDVDLACGRVDGKRQCLKYLKSIQFVHYHKYHIR